MYFYPWMTEALHGDAALVKGYADTEIETLPDFADADAWC